MSCASAAGEQERVPSGGRVWREIRATTKKALAETSASLDQGWLTPLLLSRNQRMCNGVYGQRNAILHADFAHQFGNVCLHRAFFNP